MKGTNSRFLYRRDRRAVPISDSRCSMYGTGCADAVVRARYPSRLDRGACSGRPCSRRGRVVSDELRIEVEHLKATDATNANTSTKACAGRRSAAWSTAMSYSQQTKRAVFAVYHMTPASPSTPSGTWDTRITFRSGWFNLSQRSAPTASRHCGITAQGAAARLGVTCGGCVQDGGEQQRKKEQGKRKSPSRLSPWS